MSRTQVHAVCRISAAGLWLALAWTAGGTVFLSMATAQDLSWQDGQPPRRARTNVQSYPDDEQPIRQVAAEEDPAAETVPLPHKAVDSPSSQPAKRARVVAAGDAAPGGDRQPARGTPPTPRHPEIVDDRTPEPGDPFGRQGEESDENDFGCAVPNVRGILSNRLWIRGESLLWFLRGGQTPPLLTTSPASTPQVQAGVLGPTTTTVLFGDQELNTGLHAGGRLSFGLWLDRCEESGVEFSYLILGTNTDSYSNASMGNPILARPFYDVNPAVAAQSSQLIAYPNTSNGTFNATSEENFQGAEALWRRAIVHDGEGRIDFLAGYRYLKLTDGLQIADSVTSSGTGSVAPAGTTLNVSDTFHTRNDFNGADVGFATQCQRGRWTLDTLLKVGIGQTQSQVLINGWTTVVSNGTTAGYSGGLLALPSNMGTHDSRQFSALPEIGLTLGYNLTPRLKATAGYTLLYWPNVARPGDQIDLNVDSRQFPPPLAGATPQPAFALHTSDFWAQGVNLGLDYRF